MIAAFRGRRPVAWAVGLATVSWAIAATIATAPTRSGAEALPASAVSAKAATAPKTAAMPAESDAAVQVAMLGESRGVAAMGRRVLQETKVRRGDTLSKLMERAGVPRDQALDAIAALSTVYDPRVLIPGQRITFTLRRPEDKRGKVRLEGLDLVTSVIRKVTLRRDDAGTFAARNIKPKLVRRTTTVQGVIRSSLYQAGARAGLSAAVLAEIMRIFSWDVDFQRDIQPGDRFEVAFDRLYTTEGRFAAEGRILFAALTTGGERRALYRFEYSKGRHGYFDQTGRSARKALLRTPVDGGRLASRYGRRRHPTLRYTRMHRGLDFAARRGTPIYAAGNGRIVMRGRNGAFGRYMRVRHNSTYSTAYAHLNGYKRGLRVGSRVKQGQVIGYVGSTGQSTGPHLHFEILARGRQINPLTLRLPPGRRLKGERLQAFQIKRSAVDQRIARLAGAAITVTSR